MTRDLARIADLVRAESGVRALQPHAIAHALAVAAPGLDAAAFLEEAARRPDLLSRLLDEVTVQETFFWREDAQLATIDWRSLLERARARGAGEIQAWTAGCSSGDETYTLALQAMRALGLVRRCTCSGPISPALRSHARLRASTASGRSASCRARCGCRRSRPCRTPPHASATARVRSCTSRVTTSCATPRRLPARSTSCSAATCSSTSTPRRLRTSTSACSAPSRPAERCSWAQPTASASPAQVLPLRRPRPRVGGRLRVNAAPLFAAGLAHLVRGNAGEAIAALRRTLLLEPLHAAAAFELGRAHEANGDADAARRAYGRALRTLTEDPRPDRLPAQVSAADVVAACTCRIEALS